MRASELARLTRLNDSLISKWINGQQTYVSNDDLAKIASSLTNQPREQAEIVRAHLLDEMTGPGSDLIDIRIRGQVSYAKEESPPYLSALPLKLQRAFDLLMQESITDADVRAVIMGLAGTLRREEVVQDRLTPSDRLDASKLGNADKASEALQKDYPGKAKK